MQASEFETNIPRALASQEIAGPTPNDRLTCMVRVSHEDGTGDEGNSWAQAVLDLKTGLLASVVAGQAILVQAGAVRIQVNGVGLTLGVDTMPEQNRLLLQELALRCVRATVAGQLTFRVELFAEDRHARQVTIDIAPKGNFLDEVWRRYVIYDKKSGVVFVHPYWDYCPDASANFTYKHNPPQAVIDLFNQHQHRAISMASSAT